MQKFVTLCLRCREADHGHVEEHLADYLADGWRIASLCTIGGPSQGTAPLIWLGVVLEKGEPTSASFQQFMPMMEYPHSDEGIPVEPSEIPVGPETPLEVGSRVLAYSQGRWWRAEVVSLEGEDHVKIHFPGWDPKWDTVVAREELQVDLHSASE